VTHLTERELTAAKVKLLGLTLLGVVEAIVLVVTKWVP
jgi:hypothetical protein